MISSTRVAALLAWVALSAACYAPSIDAGQFTCPDPGKACPKGWQCHCGLCVQPASALGSCADLAAPVDQHVASDDLAAPDLHVASSDLAISASPDLTATPDLTPTADLTPPPPDLVSVSPCTNGGARASRDPGLTNLAFCPAAWTLGGVSNAVGSTPACGRAPTANGKSSGNVDCSAADNCALGWHVCSDEAELTAKGLTKTSCSFANDNTASGAFYVTRVAGGPPSGQGPPVCDGTQRRTLMGCGSFGNAADASCSVISRALVETPDPGDLCATTSINAFLCPGVDGTNGEQSVVYKPTRDRGGVICCKD